MGQRISEPTSSSAGEVRVEAGGRCWTQPLFAFVCEACGASGASLAPNKRWCDVCRLDAKRKVQRERWHALKAVPDVVARRRASVVNCTHRRRSATKFTDLTSHDIRALKAGRTFCPLCRRRMTDEPGHKNTKHLDHIVPLCAGGLHVRANVRVICASCNTSRPHDGSDVPAVQLPLAVAVGPKPQRYSDKACAGCGLVFSPNSSGHRFCSDECRPKREAKPRAPAGSVAEMLRLHESGLGYKRIAAVLGVDRTSVRDAVRRWAGREGVVG